MRRHHDRRRPNRSQTRTRNPRTLEAGLSALSRVEPSDTVRRREKLTAPDLRAGGSVRNAYRGPLVRVQLDSSPGLI
jgi:hypothetical protein